MMRGGAAITGLGALSAIGHDIAAMTSSLREARGGINRIAAFSTEGLRCHYAAELRNWRATDHFPPDVARRLDRTAQLGVVAARQAVADAKLSAALLASGRVALVWGIAGGGLGAPDGPGLGAVTFPDGPATPAHIDMLERFRNTNLFAQTDAVAADLGLAGPRFTHATACAASSSAMASAMTLLRAGHADVVLVGGAESWSRAIYAGFYSLSVIGEQPMSPFSRATGVTFGEGAGCMVIEAPHHARARGAHMHGMLRGYGVTSDAHHITAPNPGGQGLARAILLSLADAGQTAERIGYVNAHGTGTPDNDVAETLAVRRVFAGHEPPVSSTKSFYGHTLGAAGILEFITALIGMNEGFLPPTLNFETARAGCDLDYVPNQARPARYDSFASISAAFGGVNVVAVGARADAGLPTEEPAEQSRPHIVVSGIGIVSPIGCGVEAFRAGLREGTPGIRTTTRADKTGLPAAAAALIEDLPARKLAPAADTRRMDALTRFAVVATTLAMKDAGLAGRVAPERIGLFVAMSNGPTMSAQIFAEELERADIAGLGAKFFPPIVMSILGGQIGIACQLRGASFTVVDGIGAGLQALAHAHDVLQLHDELDAIVVVAADEVAPATYRCLHTLNALAPDGRGSPYDPTGPGFVPGEGSVALVIEKSAALTARGGRQYGRIAGVAFAGEPRADEALDTTGAVLADAATRALAADGGALPDLVYGLARGAAAHDRREANALHQVLGSHQPAISNLQGQLGLADASSGLYAAAAALLGLRHGEAYPARPVPGDTAREPDDLRLVRDAVRNGDFRRALVLGSSEHGNSAAVLFTHES